MIWVAYYSGAGHTAMLSRAIAEGAGDDAWIRDVIAMDVTAMDRAPWDALDAAQAIVFGAPTYMGSTAARFDQFLEQAAASRWDTGRWRDKIAGGFTIASHGAGEGCRVAADQYLCGANGDDLGRTGRDQRAGETGAGGDKPGRKLVGAYGHVVAGQERHGGCGRSGDGETVR